MGNVRITSNFKTIQETEVFTVLGVKSIADIYMLHIEKQFLYHQTDRFQWIRNEKFNVPNNSARCWAVSLEVIQTQETMKGLDKSCSNPFMAMIRDKTAGAFLIKQNPLTFHNNNGAEWADWSRVIPVYFIGDALACYSLVASVLPHFILESL